jgi:hypothetical protein
VLVVGALAFVGVVVLIVPDEFGSVTSGADRISRAATRGRVANNVESVAEPSPTVGEDEPPVSPVDHRTAAALPRKSHNMVQSIFHSVPKMELPVEPVDPNPPPPPEAPPPPPPTNTIYTLPTPPPPTPNPLAVPGATAEPPAEPQGITGQ